VGEALSNPTNEGRQRADLIRFRKLLPLLEWLRPRDLQVTLFYAGIVGFLAAASAEIFRRLTNFANFLFTQHHSSGLTESFSSLPWWQRILVPMLGGAAGGLVLMAMAHFIKQRRTTDYMEAVVIGDGVLSIRKVLFKSFSSLFSISSGGSIGREGPLVQLAAMCASTFARLARVSSPKLRLLVACGAAAGIASAYHAPIAGALFVSEIVLGTTAMEIFGPLVFSSVVATVTMRQFSGTQPLYEIPHLAAGGLGLFVFFLILGCGLGVLAPGYMLVLRRVESAFARWRSPVFLKMALGGLVVGVLAIWYPQVCGNGYSSVNAVLHGQWLWRELAMILLVKVIATSATFGSGAVGGIITPTLFVGAGSGYLFGVLLQAVTGLSGIEPGSFALIGMGSFLAATTRAPLMAILMIFEMTLDYEMILPLMLACVVAYFTACSLPGEGMYSETLRRKGRWKFDEELRRVTVLDILQKAHNTVRPNAPFPEICRKFQSLRRSFLYVVDEAGVFLGAISLHDIKRFLAEPDLATLVIARDLLRENFPSVSPEDNLTTIFERFARHESERIPVLDGTRHLLGTISKSDALLAFAEKPVHSA
jgi:CIC family chloride channel protein